MSSNAKRVNFLIEESLSRELSELVPAGKRSQVVNEALRKELEIIRRKAAISRLVSGSKGDGLSTREIVSALAKDRRKHR
jgi:Arc/MetJ-type ribon-helix-helix transcriptional regulator